MMHMPKPDLIGSAEVCELLGIDRATLSRWVNHRDPKLTPVMQLPSANGRGAFLFDRKDVEALAKKKDPAA